MGIFDQAARHAAKVNAPGFFRWLFGPANSPLTFRAWLDTRRLAFPGEGDLTGDTVAEFALRGKRGQRFALVLEFQTDPMADMLERLGEYVFRLRREFRYGQAVAASMSWGQPSSTSPGRLNRNTWICQYRVRLIAARSSSHSSAVCKMRMPRPL